MVKAESWHYFPLLHEMQERGVKNYLLYPLVAPTYIGHDVESLNSNIVGLLKKHCDIPLIAWTIKNEEQYQEILAYCENIIFEGFRP